MSVKLFPAFDLSSEHFSASVREYGELAITIQDIQVELSGCYFLAMSGAVDGVWYDSFLEKLDEALNDVATDGSYASSLDPNTGRISLIYTPTVPGAEKDYVRVECSTDKSERLLGASGSISLGQGVTFGASPWYFWKSTYVERSAYSKPYEPRPVYREMEMDDGSHFGIGSSGSLAYSDWRFDFEPEARMRANAATTEEPFTFEHFVRHCRVTEPFLVYPADDLDWSNRELKSAYFLRAEGSYFKPELPFPEYQNFCNHEVMVRVYDTEDNS